MSLLYRSLQKLRRQEHKEIPVPSFVSKFSASASRKRYLRTGLISLTLIGILTVPFYLVQSRLDIYQDTLYFSEHSTTAPDETFHSQAQKKEAPVEDSSQSVTDTFHQQNDYRASPSLPMPLTAGVEKNKTAGVDTSHHPLPRYNFPETAHSVNQTSLAGHDVYESQRVSAEFPQGYSQLGLDRHLEEHFSRKAERNRRAMTINREMEVDFAAGNYGNVYTSLGALREVLPRVSPLVLKWEGILAMQRNDFEQAREKFTTVLHHSPEDHSARANLALVLVRLDQADQARQVLRELMTQSPGNPMIQTLSQMLR